MCMYIYIYRHTHTCMHGHRHIDTLTLYFVDPMICLQLTIYEVQLNTFLKFNDHLLGKNDGEHTSLLQLLQVKAVGLLFVVGWNPRSQIQWTSKLPWKDYFLCQSAR